MKFTFIQNIWREYFGVMHLAAVLRDAGHQVQIRIVSRPEHAVTAVAETGADVAAFSFTNCEQAFVLQAAALVKQSFPQVLTLAGGPHPTLHPELAETIGIDIVCRGEGEQAVVELADRLQAKKPYDDLFNFTVKRDGRLIVNPPRALIEDIDSLPYPWREGYYRYKFLADNPVKFFFTGRGCPYNCTFCFNAAFREIYPNKKRYVRHFSPERVIAEITDVGKKWPMKIVRFEDDVFTMDKKWLAQFLDLYARKIRLPYICYIRAGENEETIELLKETGCRTVLFGIESGDEQRRNSLLGKGVTNIQIEQTAALLHKHRLHFFTTNILALPGETWADALATLRLNQRIRVPDVWASIFQPYAGLPITQRAITEGLLTREQAGVTGFNTFGDNVVMNPDAERIFNLHKFFYPLARWSWLEKVLLPLTAWRPNKLFHYVWVLFYVLSYRQHTGVSWTRIAVEGKHWFRHFLSDMGVRR